MLKTTRNHVYYFGYTFAGMCVTTFKMPFDTLEIDSFLPLRFVNSHFPLTVCVCVRSTSKHRIDGNDREAAISANKMRKTEEKKRFTSMYRAHTHTHTHTDDDISMCSMKRTAVTDKQRLCNMNCYKNK